MHRSVLGLGIDIAPVDKIGRWLTLFDRPTLALVFTEAELDLCLAGPQPARLLAACFAAKEAVGKALGSGLAEIDWCDIEIAVCRWTLAVRLQGRAAALARARGIGGWVASWCAWEGYVLAQAIAVGGPGGLPPAWVGEANLL